ncbi:hypothetical protein DICVIV_13231 [Dictyocaulus viviparus]|uniref:Major facilitator superfamily (MFS) profile domain-containing protein n=1 Tax=Dictyocaulus viviparus TaxID=29172 RepID=A0A0D8X8B9_DICVI|nr:hypothetical protein DICVIV_13231 [Dictyocaulus viviparus]
MKRDIRKYFTTRERLHTDDFITFWLAFNQQLICEVEHFYAKHQTPQPRKAVLQRNQNISMEDMDGLSLASVSYSILLLMVFLLVLVKTILIGGIICCIGAVASYFCHSIVSFTLCFGGFIGVGLSLVYNAAIVIVTYNFELRRGVATALAVSGTGVGTIVFPLFLKFFVPENGTDIGPAIMAISIVLSVIIIIGLIVRDVEWQSDSPEYKVCILTKV